jgi:adenosylhomocysteine nucleosidase
VVGLYHPTAVLNFGCTGSHRAELLPGDMVIGERVVAYQNVIEGQDGTERYVGMKYLRRNVQEKAIFLPADPSLLERAIRVAAALEGQHEPWPTGAGWPAAVAHRHPQLVVGTVASADRWNRSPASIEAIVAQHGTHCEDMEAAAIALTCASHDVPFLSVKDISNNELVETSIEGPEWLALTAGQLGRRAGAVILGVLRDIAAATPPPAASARP